MFSQLNMSFSPTSDIAKVGENVFGQSTTHLPPSTPIRHTSGGKKLFKRLIKRASQPVPKEQDKQLRP